MENSNFYAIDSALKPRSLKINNIINWIGTGLKNDQMRVQARKQWKLSELQFELLLTEAKEQLKQKRPRSKEERLIALFAQAHLVSQDAIESEEYQTALDAITLEVESLLPSKHIYDWQC